MFEDVFKEIKRLREEANLLKSEKELLNENVSNAEKEIKSLTQELKLAEKQKQCYEHQVSQADTMIKELRSNFEKERLNFENVIQTQKGVFQKVIKAKEKTNEDITRKSIIFQESANSYDLKSPTEQDSTSKRKLMLLESTVRTLMKEKKDLNSQIAKLSKNLREAEAAIIRRKAESRLFEIEIEQLSLINKELSDSLSKFESKAKESVTEAAIQANDEGNFYDEKTYEKLKDLESSNERMTEKLEAMVFRDLELQNKLEESRFRIKLLEKLIRDGEINV